MGEGAPNPTPAPGSLSSSWTKWSWASPEAFQHRERQQCGSLTGTPRPWVNCRELCLQTLLSMRKQGPGEPLCEPGALGWALLTGFQGKLEHGRSNKPAALEKCMERFSAGRGSFANLKSFVREGKSNRNRDLKPKYINPVGLCLEQLGSIFTRLRVIDLNS